MSKESFKLNDSIIAHIAKLIQIGFLDGTDITDHMRMIRMQVQDGEAYMTEEYASNHAGAVDTMLERAGELQEEQDNNEEQ